MDTGLNQQSKDSQNCLLLMDELSERITLAVDTVHNMNAITKDTRQIIEDGMSTMDELTEKSQDTTNITRNVTSNIRSLEESLDEIENHANETVDVASTAEEIVLKQAGTVSATIDVFGSMNNYLENLVEQLNSLERTIESMERHRNDTLSAIQSISSVSEETAASVSLVNDSLKHQITMVGNLHDSSIELEERAKELTEAVNAFKIE